MLFAGLSPSAPGPYETNIKAVAHVARTIRHEPRVTMVDESWSFVAGSSASVELRLSFARGHPAREAAAAHVYSRTKPGFFRIYRYDQSVDVLGIPGVAAGLQAFEFTATGGILTSLFDGTERLINIVSVPTYSRQVFLPGPRVD